MMKRISNSMWLGLCLAWCTLTGQEVQQISTGPDYNFQSYVSLEKGTQVQIANDAWDIAFNVRDGEAGVFINESVGSSMTQTLTAIELYYTLSEDFSEVPDTGTFHQFPLLNPERSWSYGAFNEIRSDMDSLDYGWGMYNPGTQEVMGSNVFVARLRNGNDLKVQIQSLIGGVYTFRYANLDGSGETVVNINKADHPGKLLAYFSFETGAVVDVEPDGSFDMLFCRYTALLHNPGGGDPIPYLVTGILSGGGVEVAQADGVDPQTVEFADFEDSLSADLEVIGHDWKFFDLGLFQWILSDNLVYFVRTANDRVWKIRFTSFGGSGNGNAQFEKTDLGMISAVQDPGSPLTGFIVYPNPAQHDLQVVFTLRESGHQTATAQLFGIDGGLISQDKMQPTVGLNVMKFPVDRMIPGMYLVRLSIADQVFVKEFHVAR